MAELSTVELSALGRLDFTRPLPVWAKVQWAEHTKAQLVDRARLRRPTRPTHTKK